MIAFPSRPPRGWPDGISPGFIELGTAPSSGAGFDCAPGSIAKVGSTYYQKVGSGATAWQIIGATTSRDVQEIYRSDRFYAPAKLMPGKVSKASVGIANPGDRLWALPATFPAAGTITRHAFDVTFNASGGTLYLAIYRSSPSTPWLPGTRVAVSTEFVVNAGGGGHSVAYTPSVTVAAGDTLWFVVIGDSTGAVFTVATPLSALASDIPPMEGLDFAEGSARAAVLSSGVGCRHAFTYAQPPTAYPGGTTPTLIGSADGQVPVTLFQFSPS